jgi:prophage antirepressor-like protein
MTEKTAVPRIKSDDFVARLSRPSPSGQCPDMTSMLRVFEREFDLHQARLRLLKVGDGVWFKGGDVATALGYRNPRHAIERHIDEEDKTCLCALRTAPNAESGGDTGDLDDATVFINESGLYSLVLRSKLPSAKAFTRWVTSEVLPAIRQTGTYSRPSNSIWLDRAARIQAVGAACGAASAIGLELGEPHRQAAVAAINELLVAPEHDLNDLVDAAEYLRRRGHNDFEVRRLSSEFGRALKTTRPDRTRVHVIADFGPIPIFCISTTFATKLCFWIRCTPSFGSGSFSAG